jgi:hypothetical protein
MIYPERLVSALPLVFSVGADHDSVTLSAVATLEEPELLLAPLDEPLELVVEATARGRRSPWPALRIEAMALLPMLVAEPVPALAGAATPAALLASLAEPALCVEPPHPGSRNTVMAKAPRI